MSKLRTDGRTWPPSGGFWGRLLRDPWSNPACPLKTPSVEILGFNGAQWRCTRSGPMLVGAERMERHHCLRSTVRIWFCSLAMPLCVFVVSLCGFVFQLCVFDLSLCRFVLPLCVFALSLCPFVLPLCVFALSFCRFALPLCCFIIPLTDTTVQFCQITIRL